MGRARRPRLKHLHRKLKRIRLHLGYTRAEMAKALGCHYSGYIAGFENAKREPTFQVVVKYAELARCSADYLIDDRLELPPDPAIKTVRDSLIAAK